MADYRASQAAAGSALATAQGSSGPRAANGSIEPKPAPRRVFRITPKGVLTGLVLLLLVGVAITAVGGGKTGTGAARNLTGTFVSWQPVDDGHGYAFFTVTNLGSSPEEPKCTVKVSDDFGDFGFDILVGQSVSPGQTLSGDIPLSVGKGAFLMNHGSVTDC
ncbi:MAG TPA: hypothetical protein VKR30_06420 [Candidatus Limnocylindrales bacterium]|nr:hypothetical protein [Candidatus Limnocylindrales bacterium]